MNIPLSFASFVLSESPSGPDREVLAQRLSPCLEVPDFLSADELRNLLATRNYCILGKVQIPCILEYYKLVVDTFDATWIQYTPKTLLVDLLDYALHTYRDLGIPQPLKEQFPNLEMKLQSEALIILSYLALQPGSLEELGKRYPDAYSLIPLYPTLYAVILKRRIAIIPLRDAARAFHINPFLPEPKIHEELSQAVARIVSLGREAFIAENRQQMLAYWQAVALVEFSSEVHEVTNPENVLLEDVLEYGAFDCIPVIEDRCLYVLTVLEFKDAGEKNRNPWTGKSFTADTLATIAMKIQTLRKEDLGLTVPSLTEAVDNLLALSTDMRAEPVPAPVPIRQTVQRRLAELLSEYYITEEGLNRLQNIHISLMSMDLLRAGIIFAPQRTIPLFLGQLVQMIIERPDFIPSVAIALITGISAV
jgi:hypothetical protein